MDTATFFSMLVIVALLLGGALGIYYAWQNPQTRSRNATFSIVMLLLACYRMWGT